MKVTVKNEKARIVRNVEMMIGKIGRIASNTDFQDEIVLRAYEVLVSLSCPENTWPVGEFPNMEIELLPKGTEIILITG